MQVHEDQTTPQASVQSPWFYVGVMFMLIGLAITLGGLAPRWIGIPLEIVGAILIGFSLGASRRKPRA